jgi:hypothetical protein
MSIAYTDVSVRGRIRKLPSIDVANSRVVVTSGWLKRAQVFDEYWLPAASLPDPLAVLDQCRAMRPKPDIFTFAQRVPHAEPRYRFPLTWDNVAVIPLSSFDAWLAKQVTPATRRNIKSAEKKGVTVRAVDYDDAYVRGIMSIYDETPIRQGRRFWHYGKPFDAVKAENGTYADRSTFLAAFVEGEMVGYLKMVWDADTAAVMQVISQIKHYDKRPNNALLAEAVRQGCARGIRYLQYESFVYGKKAENSLTDFKRSNGFIRMDVPRYHVPLTAKGALALRLGLNGRLQDRLPAPAIAAWIDLRSRWYRLRGR